MRFLVIADTHLGVNYPYNKRNKDGVSSRLKDIYNIFEKDIFDRSFEKWDVGLFAGDFFDEYKIDGETLSIASDIVGLIERHNKPFYILKGNHDDDGKISVLSQYRNFQCHYCKFVVHYGLRVFGDNIAVVFIPWDKIEIVRENLKDSRDLVKNKKIKILIGHFPVKETMYSKTICKQGILKEELKNLGFDYIMLGHHHLKQGLGIPFSFYVGSPFQKDFGEIGEDHGFYIIDTSSIYTAFHKSSAPEFLEVHYKDTSKVNVKNKIVRLIFDGKICNFPHEMDNKKKILYDMGAVFVVSKIAKPKAVVSISPTISHLSPEKMLEEYVKNNMPQEFNFNEVVNFGVNLLMQARSEKDLTLVED